MKIISRLAVLFGIISFVLWATLNIAYAHSDLMTAIPAPGEQLSTIPSEIRLEFSLALRSESRLALANSNFQFVPGIRVKISGADRNLLAAETPDLAPGIYTVHWLSVGEDGDSLRGSYSFSIRKNAQRQDNVSLFLRQYGLLAGILLSLLVVGWVWFYRFYRN